MEHLAKKDTNPNKDHQVIQKIQILIQKLKILEKEKQKLMKQIELKKKEREKFQSEILQRKREQKKQFQIIDAKIKNAKDMMKDIQNLILELKKIQREQENILDQIASHPLIVNYIQQYQQENNSKNREVVSQSNPPILNHQNQSSEIHTIYNVLLELNQEIQEFKNKRKELEKKIDHLMNL